MDVGSAVQAHRLLAEAEIYCRQQDRSNTAKTLERDLIVGKIASAEERLWMARRRNDELQARVRSLEEALKSCRRHSARLGSQLFHGSGPVPSKADVTSLETDKDWRQLALRIPRMRKARETARPIHALYKAGMSEEHLEPQEPGLLAPREGDRPSADAQVPVRCGVGKASKLEELERVGGSQFPSKGGRSGAAQLISLSVGPPPKLIFTINGKPLLPGEDRMLSRHDQPPYDTFSEQSGHCAKARLSLFCVVPVHGGWPPVGLLDTSGCPCVVATEAPLQNFNDFNAWCPWCPWRLGLEELGVELNLAWHRLRHVGRGSQQVEHNSDDELYDESRFGRKKRRKGAAKATGAKEPSKLRTETPKSKADSKAAEDPAVKEVPVEGSKEPEEPTQANVGPGAAGFAQAGQAPGPQSSQVPSSRVVEARPPVLGYGKGPKGGKGSFPGQWAWPQNAWGHFGKGAPVPGPEAWAWNQEFAGKGSGYPTPGFGEGSWTQPTFTGGW
ncbi:Strn4 [Symbiodinium pilosum]|uniref:Strn4 protein n=1 Tax=Symbiodinium pilosum TaxID=2952 RepID=A0A812VLY8_SYMPI|nr:Strn4 [Symbiodinium pilosum]